MHIFRGCYHKAAVDMPKPFYVFVVQLFLITPAIRAPSDGWMALIQNRKPVRLYVGGKDGGHA